MLESNFKQRLIKDLRGASFDTVCIESHSTQNGIPDLFVQGNDMDMWIELKVLDKSIKNELFIIPWRPGQQAWALNYLRCHKYRKCCLTVVKCNDGYIFVPHILMHYGNSLFNNDITMLTNSEWKEMKENKDMMRLYFKMLLHIPYVFYKIPDSIVTRRVTLIELVEHTFGMIDFIPEIIWPAIDIDEAGLDINELFVEFNNIFYQCYTIFDNERRAHELNNN